MEIITEELVNESKHAAYTEFDRKQFIVELNVGETLFVGIKDNKGNIIPESVREFPAKYINCHANLQWQDKGTKTAEELL